MAVKLFDYQIEAVNKMKNGCILCGDVGTGKSLTSIAYYYLQNGGDPSSLVGGDYLPMDDPPKDLYIITTARKRDMFEWSGELSPFLLSIYDEDNLYSNKVVVDSWNNIKKYAKVSGAFFIFDEQRVVGSGTWVKAFLNIARKNKWILLSATPGDTWQDYIPVFVANGFYKNRREFTDEHVVYKPFSKFPQIDRYLGTDKLNRLRRSLLITMKNKKKTIPNNIDVWVKYPILEYKSMIKNRWNPYTDKPIKNITELGYLLRKKVNMDDDRINNLLLILKKHPKVIVFYNFNYELNLIKDRCGGLPWERSKIEIAEYNGHKHEPIPNAKKWLYLVQYTAGCEGWNCIETDTIVHFSQNYSYKVVTQASGRIDRINTPFTDLYYYHLKSKAGIDLAISKALREKKKFNEADYLPFL